MTILYVAQKLTFCCSSCLIAIACFRFHINMMVGGADENSPVALHLNPRFEGTDQVVRNSWLGGWGEEEREGAFPLSQGSDFEVIILFTTSCFKASALHANEAGFDHYLQNKGHLTSI